MSKQKNKYIETDGYNPYEIDQLNSFKNSFKIYLLKGWIAGCAFFFIMNSYIPNVGNLDRIVALILVLALCFEYIVHNIIIWMNNEDNDTLKYLPFKVDKKKIISLFSTIIYIVLLFAFIFGFTFLWSLLYKQVNIPTLGMLIFGEKAFALDPLTFGLIFVLGDSIWFSIKKVIWRKNRNE